MHKDHVYILCKMGLIIKEIWKIIILNVKMVFLNQMILNIQDNLNKINSMEKESFNLKILCIYFKGFS
jgi:hypothetical protein